MQHMHWTVQKTERRKITSCVIDEACSACVQINYEITNLCRGCTARSCQTNCPKKAVHVKESGQAWMRP